MTDSEKLHLLADWLDLGDDQGRFPESTSRESQKDLRIIALKLEVLDNFLKQILTIDKLK